MKYEIEIMNSDCLNAYYKGYSDGKHEAEIDHKKAHWISGNHWGVAICSSCHREQIPDWGTKYCPYCGAIIDK